MFSHDGVIELVENSFARLGDQLVQSNRRGSNQELLQREGLRVELVNLCPFRLNLRDQIVDVVLVLFDAFLGLRLGCHLFLEIFGQLVLGIKKSL